MAEQLAIVGGEGDLGGTMRLGSYEAVLAEGSVVAEAYGAEKVTERHRHRYEVNNAYREQLEAAGLVFSGLSPGRRLVEFVELPARACTRTTSRRRRTRSSSPGRPRRTRCSSASSPRRSTRRQADDEAA